MSGVSTHLAQLFASRLSMTDSLSHFQVGSEGRVESPLARLARFLVSPAALGLFILKNHARIVHINTSIDSKAFWRDTVYLAVARLLRRNVVFQVHGGELPQTFVHGKALQSWLLRRILSLPDAIVLLGSKELAAYRQFVPLQRLLIIANAVAISERTAGIRPMVSNRPLRLAFMGRLVKAKGVYELLTAVTLLRSAGVTVELALAGAGPERILLEDKVRAMNLGDAVSFRGALSGGAKEELWRWADVYVCPSYAEGLPYALLESMAAGLVPVVTPVGAVPDVLTNSVHGLLVPPRDPQALAEAIGRLDQDRIALQKMGLACEQRIREAYSTMRMSNEFHALYNSL